MLKALMCLTDDPRLIPRSFPITQPNHYHYYHPLIWQLTGQNGGWLTYRDCWVATTASDMTGTGSPIGSVADGTGSPIGQWRLVRGSASPHIIRAQPLPLAAPGSEKPPVPQESGLPSPLAHQHQLYTFWLWCPELRPGRRFSLPLEEVLPPPFFDFGMTNSTTSDCSAYLPK